MYNFIQKYFHTVVDPAMLCGQIKAALINVFFFLTKGQMTVCKSAHLS